MRKITNELITSFKNYLIEEEKSEKEKIHLSIFLTTDFYLLCCSYWDLDWL